MNLVEPQLFCNKLQSYLKNFVPNILSSSDYETLYTI